MKIEEDVKDVNRGSRSKTVVEDVDQKRQLEVSRKTAVVDVAKIEDIDESVEDVNNLKGVRGIEGDEKM